MMHACMMDDGIASGSLCALMTAGTHTQQSISHTHRIRWLQRENSSYALQTPCCTSTVHGGDHTHTTTDATTDASHMYRSSFMLHLVMVVLLLQFMGQQHPTKPQNVLYSPGAHALQHLYRGCPV